MATVSLSKTAALLGITLLCVVGALPVLAVEEFHYREARGSESSTYKWRAETVGAAVHVTVDEDKTSYLNRVEPDGSTLSWRMKDATMEAEARRTRNEIVLSGNRNGEPFTDTIAVDDNPWYQAMSYSLRQFARSGAASVRFWTLRPDTLSATKLKAERAGREQIGTLQGTVLADKVRVSTTGLLSGLWQAHYWFDTETGVFLRYEGVNGFPGTPKTVIQLLGPEAPTETPS